MELNVATTLSFCAGATCFSMGALAAYLGRGATSRHFLYAAVAGAAATVYCATNASFAARVSVVASVWAARVSFVAGLVHAVVWLAFLAAWDRRRLSRVERGFAVAAAVGSLASLVPGLAVLDSAKDRPSALFGVIYRDPDPGPLCLPVLLFIFVGQVLCAVSAFRLARRTRKALVVSIALGSICLATIIDSLSAVFLLDLPVLMDPALALAFLGIGSVVVADAAESAAKSAELERARVVLAERENLAALGQLAAVVAHEVRNPVAAIFGAITMLERHPSSDEQRALLAIVGEEAQRLKQLVTRLLDAVRPFELQYSRRPAALIVRDAVRTGTSDVEVLGAPLDEIECDEILLKQAISNLVENALVAEGRASPVVVSASVEPTRPPMLRIEVVDDGDGVPVEVRPRLFTPFFTTRAAGTGLGLALVKRIAGAHGGTVEYAPRAERGACFVLRIPIRAGEVTPRRLLGGDVR